MTVLSCSLNSRLSSQTTDPQGSSLSCSLYTNKLACTHTHTCVSSHSHSFKWAHALFLGVSLKHRVLETCFARGQCTCLLDVGLPSLSFFFISHSLEYSRVLSHTLAHEHTQTHTRAQEQTLARAHTRTCEPTQTHTHEAHFSFLTLSLVPPTWRHRHEIVPRGFFWWSDNINFLPLAKKIR